MNTKLLASNLALVVFALIVACLLSAPYGRIEAGPSPQPVDQPVRLQTSLGTLHGSLLLPATAGPHPLVLLHSGSGPTDRNGNSALIAGSNNSLKLLAEALPARGVASVRYDKRGVGASAAAVPREIDLRFEAYVDDAVAWIRQLRTDARFSTVTVVGHSEGSLIGMLAAERARADAFVSVAGMARRASDVIRDQLRRELPPDLWRESERILAALEAGRTTDDVPRALASLYRPNVQPYLISLFQYLPADEVKRVPGPVLIVQGTTDIQVSMLEAEGLKKARPDAELVIIEGMNHVLKLVPLIPAAHQNASYFDPSLPIAPLLVERVLSFVASIRKLP